MLSPFLFTLVVDWIMRRAGRRNDMQWKMWSQLDDIAFMSHSFAQTQDKTTCLDSISGKTARSSNHLWQNKIVRIQHVSNNPVTIGGQLVEEGSSFP